MMLLFQTNEVIMKFSTYSKHLRFRVALLLAVGMLLFNNSYGQKVTFLEVPVKLEVEKSDLDGVVVKVKKDGKDAFTQSGASKMRFKLDFDKKYSLIFTKDGYITKTIEINTAAPSDRIEKGFDAYKIGVKLYKQGEDNNTVVYNQPVARIKYDQNIEEFNFDTDYSKSILAAIALDKDEEKPSTPTPPPPPTPTPEPISEVKPPPPTSAPINSPEPPIVIQKAPENKKVAEKDPATPTLIPASGADEKPVIGSNSGSDQVINEPVAKVEKSSKKAAYSSGEETKGKLKPSQVEEPPNKINMNAGEETQNKLLGYQSGLEQFKTIANSNSGMDLSLNNGVSKEEEKITREDIVERNRVIVKVTVIKGSKISEYSCVNYAWGGRYFFKDNKTSINENLFVQWTGIRP